MGNSINKNRALSTMAVMSELYNLKKDVYDVISEFLKETIISNKKNCFSLTEITLLMNEDFDFNIPEAICKTALKRIDTIELSQGMYSVDLQKSLYTPIIGVKEKNIKDNHQKVLEKLFKYIEQKEEKELKGKEKINIIKSFTSFLLDESDNNGYNDLIMAFILSNEKDSIFIEQLNTVKEGAILYSGIRYSPNFQINTKWRQKLNIYLGTEILFHLAGYNGELYKTIFMDFYKLVEEVNNKEKIIYLKYFSSTKNEIDNYFKKAENILMKPSDLNPAKTAMVSILNSCQNASDIVILKNKFFQELLKYNIQEEEYDNYHDEENFKFNVINYEITSKYKNKFNIEDNDIDEYLSLLNNVSILRKNKFNSTIDNITHIFLTSNSKILSISWDNDIKDKTKIPLAVDLNFLINKLWFKLNKGFGSSEHPKSFDVITKAQILMSSHLNENINKKFEDFKKDMKEGKLTSESIINTISNLRETAKKPEEINSDDIDGILDTIKEEDIQKQIKQQEYYKQKVRIQEEEKNQLTEDLLNNKLQLQYSEEERKIIKSQLENQNLINLKINEELENEKKEKLKLKKVLLKDKENTRIELDKQKLALDNKISKEYFKLKVYFGLSLLFYYFVIYFLIYSKSWDTMEQFTWILNSLPIILFFLYSLYSEKSFDIIQLLKNKEINIKKRIYREFNFNSNLMEELDDEIDKLKSEINLNL